MLSSKDMPMMGGMHKNARTGLFTFQRVAANAPPSVATNWTAPKGMLKRIVVKLSNPKDFTMSGPKVVMPPDGIDTAVSMQNHIQVLTSKKHSLTWSQRQTPDEIPIWFIRRRSIANSLSSPLKNVALIGESGSQMNTTTEKATVNAPQKRKMI